MHSTFSNMEEYRKRSFNDDDTTPLAHKVIKTEPSPIPEHPIATQEDDGSAAVLFPGSSRPESCDVIPSAGSNSNSNSDQIKLASFKLGELLPHEIQQSVLSNDTEVTKQINCYMETLAHSDTMLEEVDLNLPPLYAKAFGNQYSSSLLVQMVEKIVKAFPHAKVLRFPSYMQVDNLLALVKNLAAILEEVKPQYKEIHLPISSDDTAKELNDSVTKICKCLLCCKPQAFTLQAPTKLLKVRRNLKKELESIQSCSPEIKLEDVTKQKVQKETKQKLKTAGAKKSLPMSSSQSKMFTFDFQLMKPLVPDTVMFTAYSYWKMETIHTQYTGRDVNVAILDTGVNTFHPAFDGKGLSNIPCVSGDIINTDTVGHGTLCAGILCGKSFEWPTENGVIKCSSGIAPDANLVVYKVTQGYEETALPSNIAAALIDIRDYHPEVDVVSISLGSLSFNVDVTNAISDLVRNGVIVVCAASNYGHQYSQTICFPARMGNVLCIGSHDSHGKASSFSPVGQQIDFLAPGEGIVGPNSTLFDSSICNDSGTSYAAPAVAGLVCLIIEFIKQRAESADVVKRYKNHWVMKEILRKISTCPGRHTYDEGFGALNPINFFRRPHELIQSVNDEVL